MIYFLEKFWVYNLCMASDLKLLSDLFDKKLAPINEHYDNIKQVIKELSERMDELEESLNSKISDTNTSIFTLRAEFREETKIIRSSLRELKRDVNKIKDNQNMIIKFFEDKNVSINKRLTRVEEHLRLPPTS